MPKGIPRNQSTKSRILRRLSIVRGHLDKVIRMVEDEDYCIDVLHQSSAVQSGLAETDKVILENHLQTCAADAIKRGRSEEVVKEIMSIFDKKKS